MFANSGIILYSDYTIRYTFRIFTKIVMWKLLNSNKLIVLALLSMFSEKKYSYSYSYHSLKWDMMIYEYTYLQACMYIIIIPLYLTCSTLTVLQTLHLPLASLLFVTISYPDVKFKFTYSTLSLCTSNWILYLNG